MPHSRLSLFIVFSLFLLNGLSAQLKTAPYELLLLQGKIQMEENIHSLAGELAPVSKELLQGKYYRLLQFYKIPDRTLQERLKREGIDLLDYIPNKAYLASLPATFNLEDLKDFGVRAVSKWKTEWKASQLVSDRNFDDWARQGSMVTLAVRYPKNISNTLAAAVFRSKGYEVIKEPDFMNLIHLRLPEADIDLLLQHPLVNFVNQIPGEGKPESDRGRAIHRSNSLDASSPMGRHYDGTGISVLVRDDGALGPHIDFHGRLTDFSTDFDLFEDHGDQVAGIAVGAGNLDPNQRGMAAGATLYNKDYVADFLDETLDLHLNEGVLLTNSSYSNGCNAGYTEITETVDRQVFENPSLIHIFSAGNDGGSNCAYGAGSGWGNITGGHKQGKNVIATGNLNADVELVASSSRGPAYDGRIKPDICSHGQGHFSTTPNNTYDSFGGTSGAAPGIMGVMTQLYQAYKELNSGELPESPLIKGVLLNSANDLDDKGPDFRTGWGHVNALKAVRTLEENRYLKDSIEQGVQSTHIIDVPAGTRQMRVMLYWADPQAAPAVEKSLINDLNLKGTDANDVETLPWILDPTPVSATLNMPATRGIDNLNNMEQVLIDDPEAGDYTLTIDGFEVPFGKVSYYLIYEFITDEITITYPNGGEGLIPGEEEQIHWDAYGTGEDFMLEYSTDDGANWEMMGTVGSDVRFYNWVVPSALHGFGECMVRVSSGTLSDTNDEHFTIAIPPRNVKVEQVCPSYIRLTWDTLNLATLYDVYLLGDKFMDSVGQTDQTFFDIPVPSPFGEFWMAVRAHGENNFTSQRTIAVRHGSGVSNCIVENDLATLNILNPANGGACGAFEDHIRVNIQNKGILDQVDFNVYYQINNEPTVVAVYGDTLKAGTIGSFEFPMPFSVDADGVYEVASWVAIPGEQAMYDDTTYRNLNIIVYTDPVGLDLVENFESGMFPPADWKVLNKDNSISWESTAAIQRDGTMGTTAVMPNLEYTTANQKDELISYTLNLTGTSVPVLAFDIAYAFPSSGVSDRLQIQVYSDCGSQSEGTLYNSTATDLKTVDEKIDDWSPQKAEDWQRRYYDLSNFIGKDIIVKFINTSRRANNLYLDNINIEEHTELPTAGFDLDQTAVCVLEKIEFNSTADGFINSYEWNFGTSASPEMSTSSGTQSVFWTEGGMPVVSLIVTNPIGADTFTQQIAVEAMPVPDFTFANDNGVVTFTNSSIGGMSYIWDFGDGTTSSEMNPVHTYAVDSTYTVTLIVESEYCDDESIVLDVEVDIISGIDDLPEGFSVMATPNPNNGQFQLQIKDFNSRNILVEIYDVLGKKVYRDLIVSNAGKSTFPINIQSLPSGVFFLSLRSKELKKTLRVVKE